MAGGRAGFGEAGVVVGVFYYTQVSVVLNMLIIFVLSHCMLFVLSRCQGSCEGDAAR